MSDKELGFHVSDIEARFQEIQERIAEFPALLDELDATVATFDGTTQEALSAMPPKELDALRSDLNKKITAVNKLKTAIGTAYDEPKKMLYAGVAERLEQANGWLQMCDVARKANKEAKVLERRKALESYYREIAGTLAEHVPFDVLFDGEWVKSDAKYKAAFEQIDGKCTRLADDWKALQRMRDNLFDYADAERNLFATFDLRATLERDDRKREDAAKLQAMKADLGIEEQAPYEPPVFEEVEPEPVAQDANADATADDAPYRKHYRFKVWLSAAELKALRDWKNGNCIGMEWLFEEVE